MRRRARWPSSSPARVGRRGWPGPPRSPRLRSDPGQPGSRPYGRIWLMDADRLDGRVALVTGAGSAEGIGFATAARLAALGAQVAIVSTTRRIHERAAELGVTGFVADLTDEAEVGALADAVHEQLGDLHVL